MKRLFILLLALSIYSATPAYAQDQTAQQPTQQPTADDLAKQKAELQKNAYRLLEQVIDEAQSSLRLPENRVRVQIVAADMLWDSNQGRARSLFGMAGEGVAELSKSQQNNNNRRGGGPPQNFNRGSFQLRQELVLAAARHDAQLAYQLLAATKPPAPPTPTDQDPRNASARIQASQDDNLEQLLLGRVAALDPKFAASTAEQMMDKGSFPRTLPEVLTQLQKQDADAAAKLADKTVKKLESANLLTNNEAANLAQTLLIPGPRPAQTTPDAKGATSARGPVLDQGSYTELLGSIVDLALKATPATQANQRIAVTTGPGSFRRAVPTVAGTNTQTQPTDAQIEQAGARRLLAALQMSLPLVDQYLPGKSALVRQKLAEVGMVNNNSQVNLAQAFGALQGNPTADALIQAAAVAPPQLQPRLYQQAAYKALDEGDTNRARQIASDHLQANARDSVMQRIDFREMAQKAEGSRIDEIRQALSRLQSDDDKIDMLLQLALSIQQSNPKLSTQLLEEAKQIASRRVTNYDQFEQQLKVAHAFAAVDPARSSEVLDLGIGQLNELMSAAAVLNGFELNMFRDGELSMQAGGGLVNMVNRFGQELAALSRTDFERAETLAGHFQLVEPRIMVRMAIVQGILRAQK
jgi:hypothetical protein